ncbi:MAG: delta-aminolevulinic acid dehydratase [Saprospiraceae bacterium]|nr:delta-aminolevulinic acid dehydratase [Saprospiraceae bacterium]
MTAEKNIDLKISKSFEILRSYCESENYKGYDPYDGLNSTFFQSLVGLRNNRLFRLAWIQSFKRSPVNLRPLLGVPKGYNPKALGLFLSGYCNLFKIDQKEEYLQNIKFLVNKTLSLKSAGWSGNCWGYNFDWQARAFYQPRNTPTVVASTYVANGLLDVYRLTGDEQILSEARSTCDFVLKDLNRNYQDDGSFCFSYSPLDHSSVFNASLLAGKLLARVYNFTHENPLLEAAKNTLEFCCKHQHVDGSWSYGTYAYHHWIDNFHTGFNLECIADYIKYSGDNTYESNLQNGLQFYYDNFFPADGRSKYYHDSIYPIDIHAPAQLIITSFAVSKFLDNKTRIDNVINWTIDHMQDKNGFFYYQVKKHFKSKIPYMRWAQAWMFYALSTYLSNTRQVPTIHPVNKMTVI